VWGTTYLAIRVALRTIPDAWMSGIRFLTAGSLMSLILFLKGHKFPPVRQWGHLIFIGISLIGFGNWLVVISEHTVPSGLAALLVATMPFYMVFLDPVVRRVIGVGGKAEGITRTTFIGLGVGFCGVSLLFLPDLRSGSTNGILGGILLLQLATTAWSTGSLYSKYTKIDAGPLVSASMQMIFGGIFLCVIAWIKGDFQNVSFRADSLIAFLYLIVFGAMVGYLCFVYALSKLPSSMVSLYAYINPVIAIWLGWLILSEPIKWTTIAATAVILSGVWLVKRQPFETRKVSSNSKEAA
jgi:drug/metabolite transporter (DMT)-like permease